MHELFCLTALEAAEVMGVDLSEVMAIAANQDGVAVKVGDAWRIDPAALTQVLRQDGLRHAA
jgi:hypothetical protein